MKAADAKCNLGYWTAMLDRSRGHGELGRGEGREGRKANGEGRLSCFALAFCVGVAVVVG